MSIEFLHADPDHPNPFRTRHQAIFTLQPRTGKIDFVLLEKIKGRRIAVTKGVWLYYFEVADAYYDDGVLEARAQGPVTAISMLADQWQSQLLSWCESIDNHALKSEPEEKK